MSEHLHVDRPFLDQFDSPDWEVLDQSQAIGPTDPSRNLHTSFREWFCRKSSSMRSAPSTITLDGEHTDAFWNEGDKIMPDFPERKEWLRQNGAGLDV